MNSNKILISIYIPTIEKIYDLFIPINKKIGTIKSLIESFLIEVTEGIYVVTEDSNFYDKDTGLPYDVNETVKDTSLKNGSEIILI